MPPRLPKSEHAYRCRIADSIIGSRASRTSAFVIFQFPLVVIAVLHLVYHSSVHGCYSVTAPSCGLHSSFYSSDSVSQMFPASNAKVEGFLRRLSLVAKVMALCIKFGGYLWWLYNVTLYVYYFYINIIRIVTVILYGV
jgi:hypothetical protein